MDLVILPPKVNIDRQFSPEARLRKNPTAYDPKQAAPEHEKLRDGSRRSELQTEPEPKARVAKERIFSCISFPNSFFEQKMQ